MPWLPPVTYYRPFPFPAENRTHFPAKTYVERQNKRNNFKRAKIFSMCSFGRTEKIITLVVVF
ncbi:unnamed protein product [Arabidopsis lyrata]|uniref:Predicted protein n=1 Tax=Arabidopsis lyrata subsp. lyrata TaxID=81972 RepID=D7KNC5_ARALL|nr:predicted protein [Arabidopsis lyrata subsp. lyrata]CAH8252055.1 unnamed protein product [Arabidopsis lyrata]